MNRDSLLGGFFADCYTGGCLRPRRLDIQHMIAIPAGQVTGPWVLEESEPVPGDQVITDVNLIDTSGRESAP